MDGEYEQLIPFETINETSQPWVSRLFVVDSTFNVPFEICWRGRLPSPLECFEVFIKIVTRESVELERHFHRLVVR